jgi:Pectate lyase superfamily protein
MPMNLPPPPGRAIDQTTAQQWKKILEQADLQNLKKNSPGNNADSLGLSPIATSGSASDLTTGTLPAARLPAPTTSTLGGVKEMLASAHKWVNAIDATGAPLLAQPDFSDLTGTGAIPTLGANTWTGNQIWNGGANTFNGVANFNSPVLIGSGKPWCDVTAPPFNAAVNGLTDDTAAVQDAINFMQSTYGGGLVFFPPGWCYVAGGIVISKAITLIGSGQALSVLSTQQPSARTINISTTVVRFNDTASYAGMRDFLVLGYGSTSAASNTVVVGNSVGCLGITIRDCRILGGYNAMYVLQSTNCEFINLQLSGMNGAVTSNGANWWTDCKLDTGFIAGQGGTAFIQGPPLSGGSVQENQFVDCDLTSDPSGNYTTNVIIDDGGTGTAITKFIGCVFGGNTTNNIDIPNARWTAFVGCEFNGKPITVGANNTSFSACNAYVAPVVVSGAGKRIDPSCFNVS